MAKATVMAVVNQKGGTGKTTTCENLGVGLAMEGKKVLLVDTDPQASLTICLGHPVPDQLSPTLSDMMGKILSEQPIAPGEGILHHPEGVDLIPANIELSGLEVSLVNAMSRETILKQYLDTVKQNYDFILLDCMPSLGMLTVNALAAADNVLIPVQAAYLPAKGLEQLLQPINKVRRQINPKLRIEGILLTMVDSRTNYSKDISNLIRENYGGKLKVYKTDIPRSVRAEEISAEGTSIFKHDPKGKVADAYERFSVIETENGYAVWDDIRDEIYVDDEGVSEEFTSEWQANDYLQEVKKAVSAKESAEWLYNERSKFEATQEPVYQVGDTVFLEGEAYNITAIGTTDVQLLPPGMVYPIYRAESKENFERLLRQDERNARFISGEEPEKTVATAEPEHFIDHYYVVEDLQVRGALQLKEYSTFEDAMRAYHFASREVT